MPEPEPDPSNAYAENPAAAALGQRLYFDTELSGTATHVDVLGRPTPQGRAPLGQPLGIACATCHDPARGGHDSSSPDPYVSVGGGLYDVNAPSTINAVFQPRLYWNGRSDSLWSQALSVAENPVSMAGNRLQIAWRLAGTYRAAYEAVFVGVPMPMSDVERAVLSRLLPDGQCAPVAQRCPEGCVAEGRECWPRFPAAGRPGKQPGCQRRSAEEPFGDAFDCMRPEDQEAVTRLFVGFGKAIAAYEHQLRSGEAPFDVFVRQGPSSPAISAAAKRGARLFVGEAGCIQCHSGPLLSDGEFHNIATPRNRFLPSVADCPEGGACDCVRGDNCLPFGALDGEAKRQKNPFGKSSRWSDAPQGGSPPPPALDAAETVARLKGAWRTPGLRNVALTAPYMHNGIYARLEQVVHHYTYGGRVEGGPLVGTPSPLLRPLKLSRASENDIVAFLETLTGEPPAGRLLTAPVAPTAGSAR